MGDSFAPAHPYEDVIFLMRPICWQKHGHWLADGLCRGVTVEPLGATIPGEDNAIEILTDDGVFRGFDDGGQLSSRVRLQSHSLKPEISGHPIIAALISRMGQGWAGRPSRWHCSLGSYRLGLPKSCCFVV